MHRLQKTLLNKLLLLIYKVNALHLRSHPGSDRVQRRSTSAIIINQNVLFRCIIHFSSYLFDSFIVVFNSRFISRWITSMPFVGNKNFLRTYSLYQPQSRCPIIKSSLAIIRYYPYKILTFIALVHHPVLYLVRIQRHDAETENIFVYCAVFNLQCMKSTCMLYICDRIGNEGRLESMKRGDFVWNILDLNETLQ